MFHLSHQCILKLLCNLYFFFFLNQPLYVTFYLGICLDHSCDILCYKIRTRLCSGYWSLLDSLTVANIVGFTKYQKSTKTISQSTTHANDAIFDYMTVYVIWYLVDAKKQIQAFATQTLTSRFSSTIQPAFRVF